MIYLLNLRGLLELKKAFLNSNLIKNRVIILLLF